MIDKKKEEETLPGSGLIQHQTCWKCGKKNPLPEGICAKCAGHAGRKKASDLSRGADPVFSFFFPSADLLTPCCTLPGDALDCIVCPCMLYWAGLRNRPWLPQQTPRHRGRRPCLVSSTSSTSTSTSTSSTSTRTRTRTTRTSSTSSSFTVRTSPFRDGLLVGVLAYYNPGPRPLGTWQAHHSRRMVACRCRHLRDRIISPSGRHLGWRRHNSTVIHRREGKCSKSTLP